MKSLFSSRKERGFALVVTLTLMVLLSILALGMLSLSGISLRTDSRAGEMARARANARMALMMAIGQLQQGAGDDRRITIAADQLSGAADGSVSSAAEGRRHWTGVYKSWAEDVGNDPTAWPPRPEPEFGTWLVTEGGDLTDPDLVKSAAADDIALVGEGTVGADTDMHVAVPKMEVTDHRGGKGAIAWWTGDQGVKAVMALPEMPATGSLAQARGGIQAAGKSDFTFTGKGEPFAEADFTNEKIDALSSWGQLSHISTGGEDDRKVLFHDIAAAGSGLLTDVRSGGFRKDFSMALEELPTQSKWGDDFHLYTFGNDTGISLREFYEYYRLPATLESGSGANYTVGGGSVPGKVLRFKDTPDLCLADSSHWFKNPLVISYELLLSFEVKPKNVTFTLANGTKETKSIQCLHVVADPILTLWNPLDVPVVIPNSAYMSFKYWQAPIDIDVTVGGELYRCPLVGCITKGDGNFLSMQVGNDGPPMVLRPGEVIKASQTRTTEYDRFGSDRFNIQGTVGFNHGGGVSYPMREKRGSKKNGYEYVNVTGKPTVDFTIKPNEYTCGTKDGTGNVLPGYGVHSNHHGLTMITQTLGEDRDNSVSNKNYSVHFGGIYLDGRTGGGRPLVSGGYSGDSGSSKKLSDRYYANSAQNADVFPTITGRQIQVGQLQGGKQPILKISFRVKPEIGSDMGSRGLARLNPQSVFMDFYDLSERTRNVVPYEYKMQRIDSWLNSELEATPDGNSYFGGSYTPQGGASAIITHSIPREPLISLGALQHSMANGYDRWGANATFRQPMLPQISHAIGNSLAVPMIDADKVKSEIAGGQAMADHSYLANRRLWDDWFFSSIAPQTADSFSSSESKSQQEVASAFLEGESPLRNPRYRADLSGSTPTETLNKLFAAGKPDANSHLLTAPLLRVEGMFNVNSTSIEAWKAVLSSLRKSGLAVQSRDGAEKVATDGEGVAIAGLLTPIDAQIDPDSASDPREASQWIGRRELDDTEIEELAGAIVKEVRKRGLFLSLSDFVNRRVGSDQELALSGAIQAALDSPDVSINKAYENRAVTGRAKNGMEFPQAASGPLSQGIPGVVKQGDILTPIAPFLAARSDSFVIRAYGEAQDKDGKVTARTWCEATVERSAEFVDPLDTPETAIPALASDSNKMMGRRFRLKSFRWLAEGDV